MPIEIIPPQIFDFFSSPVFMNVVSVVKAVFLILSAAMLGFIIFALIKTLYLKRLFLMDAVEMMNFRPFGIRKINKQWMKIKSGIEGGLESQYKLSVLEADSIVDDTLKRMGYMGETLGERLEKLTIATIPNLNEVLSAHQIRNNIVHDPDYKLDIKEAESAIAAFEKALTDLQAL